MRFFTVLILLGALLAPVSGCRRKPKAKAAATVEEPTDELASMVQVADPRAAGQLLRGFYPVEAGGWRWTMRAFAVSLPTPLAARQAVLQLKFALPEAVLKALKSVTLSAKINGVALPPQTFTQPGDQLYAQTVPPAAIKGEALTVEFELDKAFGPSDADRRELGLVVSSVGIESK